MPPVAGGGSIWRGVAAAGMVLLILSFSHLTLLRAQRNSAPAQSSSQKPVSERVSAQESESGNRAQGVQGRTRNPHGPIK